MEKCALHTNFSLNIFCNLIDYGVDILVIDMLKSNMGFLQNMNDNKNSQIQQISKLMFYLYVLSRFQLIAMFYKSRNSYM